MDNWNNTTIALAVLEALTLGFSAMVSFTVVRSDLYSRQQKVAQLAICWLLPLVGAALVHWFAKNGTSAVARPEVDPFGRTHELPE